MKICFPFSHNYKTDKIMDGVRYQICTRCLKLKVESVK